LNRHFLKRHIDLILLLKSLAHCELESGHDYGPWGLFLGQGEHD
jgi:hypothetical protein